METWWQPYWKGRQKAIRPRHTFCKETMPVFEHIYRNLLPLTLGQGHPNWHGLEIHALTLWRQKVGTSIILLSFSCQTTANVPFDLDLAPRSSDLTYQEAEARDHRDHIKYYYTNWKQTVLLHFPIVLHLWPWPHVIVISISAFVMTTMFVIFVALFISLQLIGCEKISYRLIVLLAIRRM